MVRNLNFRGYLKCLLFICLCLTLEFEAGAAGPPDATNLSPRIVMANYDTVRGPFSQTYRQCVGAGRAAEGLRAEWQAQLKECQNAIGFKYIRFHGLLHDEMGVYSEDAKGNPQYNWQYIDALYDYLLSIGVRPFVELSFMPNALASIRIGNEEWGKSSQPRKVSVFWWKANITPPKSYLKWDNLIKALTQHWTDRYGAHEVAQWYFEVWNEPDHPSFFSPTNNATRLQEYLELYDHTARAVQSVNPSYRIGGPAGATTTFIVPLIDYCATNRTPLDFISFHAYATHGKYKAGSQDALLDEFGGKLISLDPDLAHPAMKVLKQLPVIAQSPMPHLPIEVTEWGASASSRDNVHDYYLMPAFLLENLKATESGLGCMSYWTFTDIFEESGVASTPFHGGFGLINLQGIKKPAFFAFRFMRQLGDTELANADTHSWVCRDATGGVQVLLWDATHPTDGKVADNTYFRQIHLPATTPGAEIKLRGIPSGHYHMEIYRVGYKHNDPYTAYLEMGAPRALSPSQTQHLKLLASGKPDEMLDISIPGSGEFTRHMPLLADDVVLLKLIPLATSPTLKQ